MRCFLRVLAAGIAVVSMVSVTHAQPPNWRAIDVKPFDIAGVKLGMSYDDAVAALAKHYQLSSEEIKQLKTNTRTEMNSITNSKTPISMTRKLDGGSIQVYFVTRIPVNKSDPVGVSSIYYGINMNKENAAALKEAALAKYGPPSDSRRIATLSWCADYNQITDCELFKPKLKLAFGSLVLEDPTMAEAVKAYQNERSKTKPNF